VAEMVIKTVHYPIIEMERLEGEDFMRFFLKLAYLVVSSHGKVPQPYYVRLGKI
jgi:hypothetical protein